jgi:NAD(P)-dependent dehydrogenase (short-subunit alcohol dehydrogenase family)
MAQHTWLITGVSSGFGRQLSKQLLERGDRVAGTNAATMALLTVARCPEGGGSLVL